MKMEVKPLKNSLQKNPQLGEEAEVYGYHPCDSDCLNWRNLGSSSSGCEIVVSCHWVCWW